MPDSLGYSGGYTMNSNQACRPNTAPIAVLAASPSSGSSPLTVHFVGAGSDPDTQAPADTIASYTFDFGDGTAPVTQAGNAVDHVYNGAFTYTASLAVTDSRGKKSENGAEQTPPAPADLVVSKSHAGDFTQGQNGAIYTIVARNTGAGPTTSQAVSLVDTLPAGLTAVSMGGTGWTCTLSPTLGCTRNDPVAAGFQYPTIYLTVNVGKKASGTLTNTVRVSGGGQTNTGNDTAADATNIKKPGR
jgi:uncharacterized repeat protein (TIGR01451 family)